MGEERISGRQFGILVFAMMLAPLVHAVPIRVASAGRVSWLLTLPAVIPLGVLLYFLFRCLERMPEGSGLADVYLMSFGRRWGKVCCVLNALWMMLLLTIDLRFYAERYVAEVYPETGMLLFYVAILLLVTWISWGSFGALVRTGKILFWVVTVTLALVLILAAPKVKLYNVWPVTDTSAREVGLGTLRMIAVLAFAVPPCFLLGRVRWRNDKRGMYRWLVLLGITMMLIAVEILGVFGPELMARLQVPFFTLAKEISFQRMVQGFEIVVAATWIMSDTALAGVKIFAAGEVLSHALPVKRPEYIRLGLICLVFILCLLLPVSAFRVESGYKKYGMPLNGIMAYFLPALALVVGKVRRKW